jgi:transcriptional regulator with XRE-family HTH domain
MSKSSAHNDFLPPQALTALVQLGDNLALARRRRKEPLRAWAQRIGVSVRTLQRLERGDPGVGVGVVAAALWLMGRVADLPDVADPARDQGALQLDVRAARARGARRKPPAKEEGSA